MDGHTGPPTDGLATNAVVESAGGLPPTPTGDVTANGAGAAADATNEPTSGSRDTRYDALATNAATNESTGNSPGTPTRPVTANGPRDKPAGGSRGTANEPTHEPTDGSRVTANAPTDEPTSGPPATPTDGLATNAASKEPAGNSPGTPTNTPAHGPTAPPDNTPSDSSSSKPAPIHPQPTAPANDANNATDHAPSAPPRQPPTTPVPIDTHLERVRSRLTRLTPEQARDAARQGALLVDIRYAALRDRDGLIPGALVVERNELEWRLDPQGSHRLPEADRHDRKIVVLCNEGYASSLAAASLHDLGLFRATDLVGGFQAWRAAGLPVIAPTSS